MKKYLLIGGSNDGLRVYVQEGQDIIYLPQKQSMIPVPTKALKACTISRHQNIERYYRQDYATADKRILTVYSISIDPDTTMELLITNY